VAREPDVQAVVLLAVPAGGNIGVNIGATIRVSQPQSPRQTNRGQGWLSYFSLAPLFHSAVLWPTKPAREAQTRSMPQFCLNRPKLAASSTLLSPYA
jgi:hypothetical protein